MSIHLEILQNIEKHQEKPFKSLKSYEYLHFEVLSKGGVSKMPRPLDPKIDLK